MELISSLTHAKEISDHQLNIIEYPINKENLIAEYPCVNAVFISPVKKYLFTHSLLI